MTFDFWAVANSVQTQNEAAAEAEKHSGGSYINFTEPGEYTLTINRAEMKLAKAGYQTLVLRVVADSGESGFWTLLVGHGDGKSTAAGIAQRDLALILKYSGAKAFNPEALVGLRVKAWVKIEEGSDGVERPKFRPIGAASGAKGASVTGADPVATQAAPKFTQQSAAATEAQDDDDIPF